MLVFVYGTLKRGLRLHHHIADQEFVAEATTQANYQLYNCGWYPGLVECPDGIAIEGEIWQVNAAGLTILDEVEDVALGLYRRGLISMREPFADEPVEAYFYLLDVSNFEKCGPMWVPVE